MPSTDLRVIFDGTDLNEHAFAIGTAGWKFTMPPQRGENVVVPYRDGRIWVPKRYDQRRLDLPMFVIGAELDGSIPAAKSQRDKLYENVRTLQRLFSTWRDLKTLQVVDPTLGTIVADAEVTDQVDFTTQAGATRAAFVTTLYVPTVWFEDAAYSDDSSGAYTSRGTGATWSVDVTTDVPTHLIRVWLRNPVGSGVTPSNMKLYNESLSATDHWVQLQDVLQEGDEVVIDVIRWHAYLTADDSSKVNAVQWSGQPDFFELRRGINNLKLEVTDGPVEIRVEWKGRYW